MMAWRPQSVGRVDYEFRIARTELTNSQWFEFVTAFAPFWTGPPNDGGLTGQWIHYVGNGRYQMESGSEHWPATMSWQMAARYCNWLQNGKAITAEAFAQGVYDTTTFTRNPDNTWNDEREHAPGANYWLPSIDEWVKAVYYDPHKHGAGKEGYWRHPGMSDVPLISGPPGQGQTSAGYQSWDPFPVGSYPDVLTPWGLLDASGGEWEWIGGRVATGPNSTNAAFWKGSRWSSANHSTFDRIDWVAGAQPQFGSHGLRLASTVPSAGGLLLMGVGLIHQRRRRACVS